MNRIVNPPQLEEPRLYANAVVAGDTVYLAGQIGEGETLVEQFEAALETVLLVLREAGGKPADLVSMQIFVTDVPAFRESFEAIDRLWRKHCGDRYPAAGLFESLSALNQPTAMVELMGTAVLSRCGRTSEDRPAAGRLATGPPGYAGAS